MIVPSVEWLSAAMDTTCQKLIRAKKTCQTGNLIDNTLGDLADSLWAAR